jgi:hypothetical protein
VDFHEYLKGATISWTAPATKESVEWFKSMSPVVLVWLSVPTDSQWVQLFHIYRAEDIFEDWLVDYEIGGFRYRRPHPELPKPIVVFRISHEYKEREK